MAKGKSKKITLEEALVPVDEQPYQVPENWCWVRVGSLCNFIGGGTPSKNNEDFWDGDIPWASVKDIKGDYLYSTIDCISEEGKNNSATNLCEINDLLFVTRIEPGKTIISRIETTINQDLKIVKSSLDSRYLHYYFKTFKNEFLLKSSGSTVKGITIDNVANTEFPLAPLKEQQRIVEQIENLFSKLDEAKEKAQAVLEGFETRKAAILHKAFEGALTSQWRKDNNICMNTWKKMSLKECGRWFGGGTPATGVAAYWDNGNIPWITSKDMKDRIIDDSLMHITMNGVENSSANYCKEPSVLFVMRSGILRRAFPVSMTKKPFTINQDLKACVPSGINQEYLYWFCTGYEKDIRDKCMKSGTTVESVEAKKLMNYEIFVASENEQIEIVRRIEFLLNKEEEAKKAAENVIDGIELIKKSILAKAFRGELGTNNSKDGNAIELLKCILDEAKEN